MGAKHRKSKRQSSTSADYRRQLKRTTFYLERSLGGDAILEALRAAGMTVESHAVRFRHNTEDIDWLEIVGEKKWIPLMADLRIGRNPLELEALLAAKVRAFALKHEGLTSLEKANVIIDALPRIFRLLDENRFPFIAKIYQNSSVEIWRTEPIIQKGHKGKVHRRSSKRDKNEDNI